MKILVTGGAGFIGSNLVRLLLKEKGCSVVNLDKLTYAGNSESLADLADDPNYTFQQADLSDSSFPLSDFLKEHQPDAVMHLAAESHVDRSIDGPGEFIQTNVVGTFNLLQASLEYWRSLPEGGMSSVSSASELEQSSEEISAFSVSKFQLSKKTFRFLHVSTDEVYGSLVPDAPGFSETTPYDPHSPYSASKAASDRLARAWADTYGLPVLVTNCSNNYGPYQFPEKLIPVVILKCLRGEPIPVYGKGENIRDWLYVEDHAEALCTVLTKGRVGETYNIGGNNERQNIELVKMICGLMEEFREQMPEDRRQQSSGVLQPPFRSADTASNTTQTNDKNQETSHQNLASAPCPLSSDKTYESLISFVTDRPGHDLRYAIDPTKIRNELGWEPKEDFESGFRKTVQWYLDNPEWTNRILSGDYKLERLGNQ